MPSSEPGSPWTTSGDDVDGTRVTDGKLGQVASPSAPASSAAASPVPPSGPADVASIVTAASGAVVDPEEDDPHAAPAAATERTPAIAMRVHRMRSERPTSRAAREETRAAESWYLPPRDGRRHLHAVASGAGPVRRLRPDAGVREPD